MVLKQDDLNYYVKLYNDTVFYRYTIKTTQDDVKREVTFNRLHDTRPYEKCCYNTKSRTLKNSPNDK